MIDVEGCDRRHRSYHLVGRKGSVSLIGDHQLQYEHDKMEWTLLDHSKECSKKRFNLCE